MNHYPEIKPMSRTSGVLYLGALALAIYCAAVTLGVILSPHANWSDWWDTFSNPIWRNRYTGKGVSRKGVYLFLMGVWFVFLVRALFNDYKRK